MGRKTNKQQRQKQAVTARERAAAARADQQRAEQRRRAMVILGSVLGVVVLVVVIALVVITRPTKNDPSGNRTKATAAITKDVTSVSPATFATVGEGGAQLALKKISNGTPLTSGGKPELLFIGGEFCPICAAERWSLTAALSRFGTFSDLSQLRSAADDGDIATLSYYKSHYTSKYLTFVPVENVTRSQTPLQNLTKAQLAIYKQVAGTSQISYPFLDYGGVLSQQTEGYDGTVLGSANQTVIADQLNNPKSKVAKAVDGEANNVTAAICTMTKNQPSTVCSTPVIKSIQSKLNA